MTTLVSYVPLIDTEAERLAQFLETLAPVDLQRGSACELWEVRDVVAHLIWGATFYTDTLFARLARRYRSARRSSARRSP